MIKKILLALAVLVAVFVIIVATRPADFRVERSIPIAAKPEAVFSHLNNSKALHAWSPWVKMDPQATFGFEGPDAGVGSVSTWSGPETGAGRQTIVASRPYEHVHLRLEFVKPFAATHDVEFILRRDEASGTTIVTWAIWGKNNFLAKAMCLFLDQDKMVGGPFEAGLSDLKALVESGAAAR